MRKLSDNGYKIAIYIRVSTEEQAENPEGSVKNQEERLRDYVKQRNIDGLYGEIVQVFNDPGYSAKDTNRPAFQRMLSAVRSGEINLVLVTEISRLTRSTKDFAILWDFLKEHNCKFQSLRDNFDTTTPSGEMIMFTLASFAQFERKQMGERISNSFQARAKRGLWNGGVLPLGYESDSEKPGHLKVVESEAEIVKEVFTTFLRKETLSATGKELNDNGVKLPRKPRNGGSYRHAHFTVESTYRLLTNPAYIAKRVYQTKDGKKEAEAQWEPLIDEVTFKRVQTLLANNKSKRKPASKTRYPYLLSGLTVCKTCGDRLCGKSAHGNGGKIGYYEHSWSTKTQSCLSKKLLSCEPHRILAKKIEPVVWEDVKRLLSDPKYASLIFKEAKKMSNNQSQVSDGEKLKAKISSLKNQIEITTERITELPKGVSAHSFYDQILKLQKAKEDFETKFMELQANITSQKPINLDEFQKFTADLNRLANQTTDTDVKAAICRKLIEKIEVSPKGVTIHYHVGDQHFEREFSEPKARGLVEKSARPLYISRPLHKYRASGALAANSDFHLNNGSNNLTNGRGCKT